MAYSYKILGINDGGYLYPYAGVNLSNTGGTIAPGLACPVGNPFINYTRNDSLIGRSYSSMAAAFAAADTMFVLGATPFTPPLPTSAPDTGEWTDSGIAPTWQSSGAVWNYFLGFGLTEDQLFDTVRGGLFGPIIGGGTQSCNSVLTGHDTDDLFDAGVLMADPNGAAFEITYTDGIGSLSWPGTGPHILIQRITVTPAPPTNTPTDGGVVAVNPPTAPPTIPTIPSPPIVVPFFNPESQSITEGLNLLSLNSYADILRRSNINGVVNYNTLFIQWLLSCLVDIGATDYMGLTIDLNGFKLLNLNPSPTGTDAVLTYTAP